MSARLVCPSCSAENPEGQRFCGACGASLERQCAGCGHSNPAGFRFCGGCGAAIEGPAEPTASAPEERRWATVLFADLSGFTSRSEDMDPEDVRAMVDRCMAEIGPIIERFGGSVTHVAGDAVMALFGAPVSHEDDPERAVRAALEIQRCARERTDAFAGLKLRIGVNTGEVMVGLVGPPGHRVLTAIGDVANTAARLQTAAPVGGVLVGEETAAGTRRSIAYDEIAAIQAKGKQAPVAAWLAREVLAAPGERPVSRVPMVGRGRELALLEGLWQRVKEERRPHLITVIGPPGVGKSRLLREFAATIEAPDGRLLVGRSLPYSNSTGYGAFAQIVNLVAGIYETDPDRAARRKLTHALHRLLGTEEVDEVADALGVLSGLSVETAPTDRQVLFSGARELVEVLAREQPTVFVFEDLHWADRSLLDLVEWLASRVQGVPALFFTVARPELLDTVRTWGGGLPGYTAVRLDELSEAAAADLAGRLMVGREDAGEGAGRLLSTSAGNPLFMEEMAAWLAEAGTGDDGRVPTSIKTMIAARIDALPPSERRTVLDASVVGSIFWRGALERLGGGRALQGTLDSLEARDLVRRSRSSVVRGDQQFFFKHDLIREVAYATLPKAERRDRHRIVAEYIEEAAGDSTGSAAILGHHWREAGDNDRAFKYLLTAAEQATRGWADEAVELYAQALSLVPESDTQRHRSVRLKRVVAYQRVLSLEMWRKTIRTGTDAPEGGPTS